ncbi:MAG TPA: heavy metal translocating P-type ATPase [Candidatus Cloacimonadota bacterium]|nr:heavy metal translocating P-type ATPase [Candidatus Cloacimonadota bacterium]HQL15265.1 heavy metal translocating P-type ATPase [Candidatus Cloacimonadota bacterium]
MKQTITLGIDGMHCASCSASVEKALSSAKGVLSANVSLPLEEASVEYDSDLITPEQLKQIVVDTGFKIRELLSPETAIEQADYYYKIQQKALYKMILAWGLTALVLVLMLPEMLHGKMLFASHTVNTVIMTGLSLLTMLIPARQVYVSAYKSLRRRAANMDVLIALGTIAALITGPLSLVIKLQDFSGIAAMIIAFHLTGRYLETSAKGKAGEAIRKLMNLGVKTAILWKDNAEYEIPANKIKVGDKLVVKPGAQIPTDGIVLEGASEVDESMATGEAMPVLRKQGDTVLGATINQEGRLLIEATRVGQDTFLAQMVRLVREAQHSKVPVQVLADRITAIFVPVILFIAALTFLAWYFFPQEMQNLSGALRNILPWQFVTDDRLANALMAMIATLVIACPCALGLATPTALMVGSGMGAWRGILIRNGEALQRMKEIKVMVFDKTGTLTYGKPELIKVLPLRNDENTVLQLAASLESGSEHPIAQAVINAADNAKLFLLSFSDFRSLAGKGIQAKINDKQYYLGNLDFISEQVTNARDLVKNLPLDSYPEASVFYLASDDTVLGCLLVADTVKPEAASVINELKKMEIIPVMLSGDNSTVAQAIAKQCGIERVFANVLPADKVAYVRNLQQEFGAVAMVGDGINDAPALKQADIGIAMGKGTDIAMEAADITIVRNDLTALLKAINLSRATFKKIKQNLFWAFFYNLIAIPLAVLGVLHPVIAEIAMAISSLTVVTNANMLRQAKI